MPEDTKIVVYPGGEFAPTNLARKKSSKSL